MAELFHQTYNPVAGSIFLSALVATLPLGLDTRIGSAGERLSGGQRQRVAVARTLLAGGDVVLLDEPTAQLDEQASARLMADLLETAGADYGFGLKNLPGVIHYALKHYGPAYELLQQETTRGRILPVLYESLVNQPEVELERLREFTGLMLGSYHPGQSWSGEVPADTPIQHAWTSELYGQPVSNSRVGNYRHLLSPEAIQLIEAHCQAFMQIFGYATGPFDSAQGAPATPPGP